MGTPWGECARCGFDFRVTHLRKEWTGFRVCGACFDCRPPDTRPPVVKPEGLPVANASPATEPIFREEGDPGGSDL